MQFSLVRSCLLALAASVSVVMAQTANFDVITAPVLNQQISAGSTFTIKWTPSSEYTGTISIVLLQGTTNLTLQTGPSVATSIPSTQGTFDWTIPSSYGTYPVYGLKLTLDSAPTTIYQYSFPFEITGSSATVTSGSTVTVKISQISTLSSTSSSSIFSSNSSSSIATNTTANATSTYFTNSSTAFSASATPHSTSVTLTSIVSASASATSASASATKSSAAMAGAAIGGSSIMGALLVAFGLLI